MEMLNSWWGGGKTEKETISESKADAETDSKNDMNDIEAENTEKTQSGDADKPAVKPELNITAEAALTSAKEWGSYLFNVAMEGTKKVTETAAKTATIIQKTVEEKTIVGDFKKEQDKFVKEKHSKRAEAAVPPWVGYNEEEQMKEQILALSQDKRNFLRNPPAGVQFQFDFASMFPVAMATLHEDDKLQKMRFDLVPKQIVEENFWRNYFYRVSLIKQSSQLTSLAASSGNSSDSGSADSGSNGKADDTPSENVKDKSGALDISVEPSATSPTEDEVPGSPPGAEFISDAFVSEIDQAEIQKGFEQLGMDKKEEESDDEGDIPEWEKELQQELQDYEVVEEDDTGGNEEWEREIDQMLEEEGAPDSK
ncbi:synapse-associated protein 1-like isoform X1 [Acanthaster planci]|uniref:Synapse-associated protein 1-like isoform X1 n=1 Tax=Acanthaster planci TaxID=133434 RepID=A0A8B7Z493_ACAPL|nr:synapse-associated protein 1-like isoform X1 [Acanthaster planci]